MTVRDTIVLTATAALLVGCATAQENPNYQFSSKYDPQGAPTQMAQSDAILTPQVASTEPVFTQQPPVTYAAPEPEIYVAPYASASETEEAFDAATMDGTPGYVAMMAQQDDSAPTPAPVATPAPAAPGPRPVTYDYSQNVIVADTAIAAPAEPTVILPRRSGETYIVHESDTIYSLARARCVPMAAITEPNDIGADYAIKIGQTITLPESRC